MWRIKLNKHIKWKRYWFILALERPLSNVISMYRSSCLELPAGPWQGPCRSMADPCWVPAGSLAEMIFPLHDIVNNDLKHFMLKSVAMLYLSRSSDYRSSSGLLPSGRCDHFTLSLPIAAGYLHWHCVPEISCSYHIWCIWGSVLPTQSMISLWHSYSNTHQRLASWHNVLSVRHVAFWRILQQMSINTSMCACSSCAVLFDWHVIPYTFSVAQEHHSYDNLLPKLWTK